MSLSLALEVVDHVLVLGVLGLLCGAVAALDAKPILEITQLGSTCCALEPARVRGQRRRRSSAAGVGDFGAAARRVPRGPPLAGRRDARAAARSYIC